MGTICKDKFLPGSATFARVYKYSGNWCLFDVTVKMLQVCQIKMG